ncbi:hypothetical protein CR513_21636, partial [Mucuna pruriens]
METIDHNTLRSFPWKNFWVHLKFTRLSKTKMKGNKKESPYPSKLRRLLRLNAKESYGNTLDKDCSNEDDSPSFQGRSNLCGSTRDDQDGRTTLGSTPRKRKTRRRLCKLGHFKSECPNIEKKEEKQKKKSFIKKKKSLMATWEDLDLSSSKYEDEEANLYLMADITSEDEDDE